MIDSLRSQQGNKSLIVCSVQALSIALHAESVKMAERQTASPLTADVEMTSKDDNDNSEAKNDTPVSAIKRGYPTQGPHVLLNVNNFSCYLKNIYT